MLVPYCSLLSGGVNANIFPPLSVSGGGMRGQSRGDLRKPTGDGRSRVRVVLGPELRGPTADRVLGPEQRGPERQAAPGSGQRRYSLRLR